MITGRHHAQFTVPRSATAAARDFYCNILGLPEIPKPESLQGRSGFWLQVGDSEVHVGVEDGVERHLTKAHMAYAVTDLAIWQTTLTRAGFELLEGEPIPGFDRFELRNPFGNRGELIEKRQARNDRGGR